jgi:hypothetical protein
VLEASLLA